MLIDVPHREILVEAPLPALFDGHGYLAPYLDHPCGPQTGDLLLLIPESVQDRRGLLSHVRNRPHARLDALHRDRRPQRLERPCRRSYLTPANARLELRMVPEL